MQNCHRCLETSHQVATTLGIVFEQVYDRPEVVIDPVVHQTSF